jgi:3-hydroxyisobutyrate dehydrogenase-like beta-hydroxyacid dehydrogenase
MLERLNAQGLEVSGWNRTARPSAVSGVVVHDKLGDLVAGSDIILLSLFDDQAVQDVVQALCQFDLAGKLFVDTSTTRPETLRGLEGAISGAGAQPIDAPIAGGPDMVLAGTAGLYVGGTTPAVERFRPVAEAIAARVIHVGGLGAGATAKVFNNMMLCGYWEVLKEAMLTGREGGLSLEQMVEILSGSPAASPAFKGRIPVLLGETDSVGFSVAGVVKDAVLFAEVARNAGVDAPALDAALQSFRDAAAAGHGGADLAMMVRSAILDVSEP